MLDQILWSISILLDLWLLRTMLKSGQSKVHHWFFRAILLHVARSICLLPVYRYPTAYYWAFWGSKAIQEVVFAVVIFHVYKKVFSPIKSLPRGTVHVLVFGVTMAAAFALAVATFHGSISPNHTAKIIRTADHALATVFAGAVFILIGCADFLGINRRPGLNGILIGFAFFLSVHVFRSAAVNSIRWSHLGAQIDTIAYLVTLVVWIHYLRTKIRPHSFPPSETLVMLRQQYKVAP